MNLKLKMDLINEIGIPRVSGDEPVTADYDGDHSLYSPRERG